MEPSSIPPRLSEPPRLPPVIESVEPPPQIDPPKPKNAFQRAWAGFVALVAATWKFAYPVFKLAKGGKLLLTAGTMLLSIALYAQLFGWWFGVGFVVCIFIHEMGHVFAAWRLKMPVSAPIFIPFMGALILSKRMGKSGWENAVMGIGGPAFGALSAFGCWGIYAVTGQPLFLGLAYTSFFMNLFNMMPMFPLDGGWITGAISPYLWVLGLVGLVVMAVMGQMHNPFIWILLILSLPRVVSAFKKGNMDQEGYRTTGSQRVIMGLAYLALSGVLFLGMIQTQEQGRQVRKEIIQARRQTPAE